jgi:hypothetical protein
MYPLFFIYLIGPGLLVSIVAMILYIVVEAEAINMMLIFKNILLLVVCSVLAGFIYGSVIFGLDALIPPRGAENVPMILYILMCGFPWFNPLIAIALFILLRKTKFRTWLDNNTKNEELK